MPAARTQAAASSSSRCALLSSQLQAAISRHSRACASKCWMTFAEFGTGKSKGKSKSNGERFESLAILKI
jgi:hypothetical protein